MFSRVVLSSSFCFPILSSGSCPFSTSTVFPPLPNSWQHSGAASAIFVVSFRLMLQESLTWVTEFLLPTCLFCTMGASAFVKISVDSLNLQSSADSVASKQNKPARKRASSQHCHSELKFIRVSQDTEIVFKVTDLLFLKFIFFVLCIWDTEGLFCCLLLSRKSPKQPRISNSWFQQH